MSECMMFPKNWEKFIEDYSFKDSEEVYTNGTNLVPVFRVEQMVEHYFATDNNVGCKWIPVSERLPEKDGRFLVYKKIFNSMWVDVLSFVKDGRKVCEYDFAEQWENVWYFYDSEYGHIVCNSVTHWMPMPEPPQEVSNGQT